MREIPKDHFYLPDILATWPYERRINPFYEDVKAESAAWAESFHTFDEPAQRKFNLCDFSKSYRHDINIQPLYLTNVLLDLGAALALSAERLRTCADVFNFVFTFDEWSDLEDEHGVRRQYEIIMDALRNPHTPRPPGECVLGEMARQMWARALPTTPPHAQRRFVETFDTYAVAVVQEAEDRRLGRIRGIESYMSVRRGTAGVLPFCALVELDMKMDAEIEEILGSAAITELDDIIVDMTILGQDMVSYIMERDMGHGVHNIVTAAMHSLRTDVPGALRWVEEEHARLIARFLTIHAQISPVDPEIERYIWGIANWVRAADCWFFESQRYFGERGMQVKRERWTWPI